MQLVPTAGAARVTLLGGDPSPASGTARRLVVPAGVWQGARLAADIAAPRGWALLGCTMTPAWDERGFVLGERAALRREFPGATDWIHALTR